MIRLSQINIFPIKSMQGISLNDAIVEERGIIFDRRLMLVDVKGNFVTARKYPKLLKIQCQLANGGLIVDGFEMPTLTFQYSEFYDEIAVTIWRELVTALAAPSNVNQWFSRYLGTDVTLCYLGDSHSRYREKIESNVSLADGYPLLLIGQQSLAKLNSLASESSAMEQFRTNLVIEGALPFEEDHWQRIRIGEVEFELVKPCERCIMTTADPNIGEFKQSKEPLATLAKFRADEKGRLMFGENLIARSYGKIMLGDEVKVLSLKKAANYGAKL